MLRAGLVEKLEELNRSPWSGHSALAGYVERHWQDTQYVLSFLGSGRAKKNYMEFVERGVDQGKKPELVGGGLIRSMGGWFEVFSLRRSGNKQASDQRILGDGDFVSQVLQKMDDLGRENFRLPTRKMGLAALAEKIFEVHGIHAGELRSGSRRGEIVEARRVLSWMAVKELGYSGAAVARYLGVTNSCLTRAVSAEKVPQKEKYI